MNEIEFMEENGNTIPFKTTQRRNWLKSVRNKVGMECVGTMKVNYTEQLGTEVIGQKL